MASNYWAKIWIDILEEAKVATLPDSSWRRFVECILLAKQENKGGLLPDTFQMAFILRINEATLKDDMTRLALAGLVELRDTDQGERWFIPKFEDRQSQTISGADKTRRWREKKEREETERFNSVTQLRPSVTGGHPETETETETEGEKNARARQTPTPPARQQKISPPPPQDFEYPEDTETRRAHADMLRAVSDVTGMDSKLNSDVLLAPTLGFVRAGYTAEQVRAYYSKGSAAGSANWYQDDWRGRKGDRPTLKNIIETIGAVKAAPVQAVEGGKLWLDHMKVFTSASTE